jgi:hypothetical protein
MKTKNPIAAELIKIAFSGYPEGEAHWFYDAAEDRPIYGTVDDKLAALVVEEMREAAKIGRNAHSAALEAVGAIDFAMEQLAATRAALVRHAGVAELHRAQPIGLSGKN